MEQESMDGLLSKYSIFHRVSYQCLVSLIFSNRPYVDPIYSYSFGRSNGTKIYRTVGQQLEVVVNHCPDRTAVISVHQGLKKTYRQMNEDANKVAKALWNLGIRRGDVISMWSANLYEFFAVQYGAAKIGAIYCSISPLNKTSEIEHILSKGKVKAIFLPSPESPQNFINNFMETLNAVDLQNKAIHLKNVVFLEGKEPIARQPNGLISQGFKTFIDDSDGILTPEMIDDVVPEDICNLFFTSGTTGKPKGAASSHYVMMNNQRLAMTGKRHMDLESSGNHIVCLTLPLFHGFAGMGAVYALPVRPATIVLPDYRYTAEAVISAFDTYKCTDIWLVPTMAIDVMQHAKSEGNHLESLKLIVSGAAPVPEEVVAQAKKQFPNLVDVLIGYGATETGPVAAYPNYETDQHTRNTTCGTAVDFNEIKIVDSQTRKLVKHNETGEVCIRGWLMDQYFDDEEKTREAIQHGWYLTGDLGTMDDKGLIRINGRTKEMIIRGGVNIYPREVEDLLHQHPAVENVAVCGIKHEKLGEEVVAWIKRKKTDSGQTSKDDIKKFCKEKISYYKIPSQILFVEEFPVTLTGKFQKFAMTEQSPEMIRLQTEEGKFL
jgi:fatty-acyl-CoA synthase